MRLLSMAWLRTIPWLKYGVLFNPIVYMSEGLRAAVTPSIAHILVGIWWRCCSSPPRWTLGLRGFLGRVLS